MKNLSLFGMLLLVFFACRNDIDEDGQTIVEDSPPIIVNQYDPESDIVEGTIYGRVYDENENPVEDATIKYDGKTFTTDEEGRFFIKNEALDREGTFFTVEAEGFFKGSRRLYPKDGSINYAYVQLLALNEIGSFSASDGGEINGTDGLSINFPPNSIRSASGGLYNGQVSVAAKWLDPTASNIAEIMPGDLLGLSARVEEVSLVTYGMMAVELFDENGNNINIAEGSTATLSFPVPQDLINQAPSEIPLWSFEDEQYGIWAEEGTATLQGNKYVGQVSHFSFWNCDAPFPIVNIEGQLLTPAGTPLPNARIGIFPNGGNSGRYGTTDNEGFFAGKMPQDQELILRLGYPGIDCEFVPINLGSFSEDTNIGPITLEESGATFTISGSVLDCDDNPIENGLVRVQIGNTRTQIYVGDDSTFESGILNCDNSSEISITAVDLDDNVEGEAVTLPVEPEVDFGTITACGNDLTQFFTLTVDGETATSVEGIKAEIEFGLSITTGIDSTTTTNQSAFTFDLFMEKDGSVGTYSELDFIFMGIILRTPDFNEDTNIFCEGSCQSFVTTLIINENGGSGGFLAGELNGTGTLLDDTGGQTDVLTISASFRVPIL